MRRREFVAFLVGATAWPRVSEAQQPSSRIRRVGVLMNNSPRDADAVRHEAIFAKTLEGLGWEDGRSITIDVRWSEGDRGLMKQLAMELIDRHPDVILSASTSNLASLLAYTREIPIVFVQVSDPVAQGFVANLKHPGGNITGFAGFEFSLGGKWLDLLKQIAPNINKVFVVSNPDTSPQSQFFQRSIEAAGPSFGIESIAAAVHSDQDIERVIEGAAAPGNAGLIFPTDSFIQFRKDRIIELVTHQRLPALYAAQMFVRSGGLMSYQVEFDEQYRQAASYVDRILKGNRPGDLPVQLATKFSLVVNQKAARAIGVDLPMGLLMRADEIIE
jgi:putative tryptophan/tyrosine transport system substrate-binding protein